MLRPELADDKEFRARFRREAATLEKVRGLCTVRVIEADSESPRPFLVTEYRSWATFWLWLALRVLDLLVPGLRKLNLCTRRGP
jgi:heme-degrading monooxygenase HmoA